MKVRHIFLLLSLSILYKDVYRCSSNDNNGDGGSIRPLYGVMARETTTNSQRRQSRLIMRIEEYLYKSRDIKTSSSTSPTTTNGRKRPQRQNGMGDDDDNSGGGSDDDNDDKSTAKSSNRKKQNETTPFDKSSRHDDKQADNNPTTQPILNSTEQELEMVLQRDVHEDTSSSSSPSSDNHGIPTTISENSIRQTLSSHVTIPQRFVRRLKHTIWESLDDMDRLIVTTTLPIATLFFVLPLVNAGDAFWVARLGDTVATAAQQASNQIYMSIFFLMNFLPSITAIQVSKSYASNDKAGTQDAVCQALLLAVFISSFGTAAIVTYPQKFLSSILQAGAPALPLAVPYLRLRSFSCLPMLVSFIGFSAFRGTMDVSSCIKITVLTSVMNMILDPIMIHVFRMGITGSAVTSLLCDWFAAINYVKLMLDNGLITRNKLTKLPSWKEIGPLIRNGLALQVRSLAQNLSQIFVARKIHSLDDTGVSTAAFVLAMQALSVGGVVLTALGMATQTLFPGTVQNSPVEDRSVFVRALSNRFLVRGAGLGLTVSLFQLMLFRGIINSSPLPEVRSAAVVPMLLIIGSQALNGIIQVADGIIMGDGKFTRASINLVLSTLGYMACLQNCPNKFGLTGVFGCMIIFTVLRLGTSLMYLPVIYNENDDGDVDVPPAAKALAEEETMDLKELVDPLNETVNSTEPIRNSTTDF